MRTLNASIEHVRVPEGVVMYDTLTDRWFLAEGAAADAVDVSIGETAGRDTLRAAGLAPGRPRTNGRGRVRELSLNIALGLLASKITLASGAALAMSASYAAAPMR